MRDIIAVSPECYAEIREVLITHGIAGTFEERGERGGIDMNGIFLVKLLAKKSEQVKDAQDQGGS